MARIEKDTLGCVEVPDDAYYGAQTARALSNFAISGLKPHDALVWSTVVIKKCAALANMATGRLAPETARAIVTAADEALAGRFAGQFLVDPFQAGAGTSHNMNVNEVLANRASELLGGKRGDHDVVHPNDHVNMAQSTNDVFPTAMRLASLRLLQRLLPEVGSLATALSDKGKEFDDIIKSGRTHLQDAVPIRLGQEFAAYGKAVSRSLEAVQRTLPALQELGIGGTAVGTGLNAEPQYIELIVDQLAGETGHNFTPAENLVEAMQNMAPFVQLSSALKELSINLIRISNDLRLLSSGPRTGLGEITLPPLQPGSSIMPGKVNPVMPEVMTMVAFQVIGSETVVTMAAQAGQLELNVMMPVIAYNLLFSMEILTNTIPRFTELCIRGITANRDRCLEFLEQSVGLVTIVAPHIGYTAAAEVANESVRSGKGIKALIIDKDILPASALEQIMDPYLLTTPGVPGQKGQLRAGQHHTRRRKS